MTSPRAAKRPEHPAPVERPLDDRPPLHWLIWTSAAAALVAALLFSSVIYFSMTDHGHDWWRLFGWQLVCWAYWAAVSPWVLRSGARLLRPEGRPPFWLGRLLGLAVLVVTVHLTVATLGLVALQPYLPVAEFTSLESFERIAGSWIKADPVVFAVLVAMGYGLSGFWMARNEELSQSRLQALLAKAELEALRLKFQPHFLFNTLNGIAALVRRRESDRALEMLLGLSDLLRAALDHDNEPLVPLGEELGFTRRYLRLQQLRFEDRLQVSVVAPEDCLAASVPFLLLQPLAENAIQHGIARRSGSGTVDIAARREDTRLVLTVSDDGAGLPDGFALESDGGLGLSNTRAKLAQIYPAGTASLEILRRPTGGTEAIVRLPLEVPA